MAEPLCGHGVVGVRTISRTSLQVSGGGFPWWPLHGTADLHPACFSPGHCQWTEGGGGDSKGLSDASSSWSHTNTGERERDSGLDTLSGVREGEMACLLYLIQGSR